ncbi:MAG: RAMP superfamily CRISPR-associated protein [Actinomycetales bacterium]
MTSVTFTIRFRTPFHVGTGLAVPGLDRIVDREALLPPASLKGLMRAQAEHRLRLGTVVGDVFGTARTPSPWAWNDVEFSGPRISRQARIRVQPGSRGTVKPGGLFLAEQVTTDSATFVVELKSPVENVETHLLVLRASARAVTALGGSRRRGMGWVSITAGEWTDEDTARLMSLKEVPA